MKIAVVMTTIHNPENLKMIQRSLSNEDHIVIATDRKTPFIQPQQNVHIMDIPKQIAFCKNPIGVPFDCIQRRNMGYLYAIKQIDPDVIITIDDDNFPPTNWVKEHVSHLGQTTGDVYNFTTNIIDELLKISCDYHEHCFNVVHRGVCFSQALEFNQENKKYEILEKMEVNVGVNAGMWAGDPDINAYDRILHPNIKSADDDHLSLIVEPKKWFHPFNSQNTSFVRALFPTLFLVPMYAHFYGYKFGRFDDIWQSYVCQKIMAHHNMCVRFGSPVVKQNRNEHNVIRDLEEEYPGLLFTSKFIEALNSITLLCRSPLENMYEIADIFLLSKEEILNYVGQKMLWWLTELK